MLHALLQHTIFRWPAAGGGGQRAHAVVRSAELLSAQTADSLPWNA